jgi:hypothetical protein
MIMSVNELPRYFEHVPLGWTTANCTDVRRQTIPVTLRPQQQQQHAPTCSLTLSHTAAIAFSCIQGAVPVHFVVLACHRQARSSSKLIICSQHICTAPICVLWKCGQHWRFLVMAKLVLITWATDDFGPLITHVESCNAPSMIVTRMQLPTSS